MPGLHDHVIVRAVLPGELPAVGDLRVAAYTAGDFLSDESYYTETLRTLGADGTGEVLAAVLEPDPRPASRADLLGTVMLQWWPDGGHVAQSADEAEIRALAVDPQAQGRGVGRALLRAAAERAVAAGACRLVLCTQPTMLAAQRLYVSEGYRRLPDRDWSPVPGFTLLAYGRALAVPSGPDGQG